MKKVWVIYGGRSGEHEISLRSAYSVAQNLDRSIYEVSSIGISKAGTWYFNDPKETSALINAHDSELKIPQQREREVIPVMQPQGGGRFAAFLKNKPEETKFADVVFPVMHGPLCEDGAIQGALELVDATFVGSGVLGSAVAMDKEITKRLARDAGVPILPFFSLNRHLEAKTVNADSALYADALKKSSELGYPVFVKPARMGSSVGVHKVKSESDLLTAIQDAFQYDTKILIEKGVDAKEIELSVLQCAQAASGAANSLQQNYPGALHSGDLLVSLPGEVIPRHEFYSYEAKYLDPNGAQLNIPAKLKDTEIKEAQKIALQSFSALELRGFARVDLLQDKKTGKLYLNEPNTLPGFTSISMYPKLWEATGLKYSALLTALIEEALERNQLQMKIQRSFRN